MVDDMKDANNDLIDDMEGDMKMALPSKNIFPSVIDLTK